MFDRRSYIGYTLIFCVPPLVLMWLRKEFAGIIFRRLGTILLSALVLMVYGCLLWPVAIKYGAWSYGSGKISGIILFRYVYLDDVIWWLFVVLVFSSFVVLSAHYEEHGEDIFLREVKGLLRSFINAFLGFRVITFEQNSTIHIAVAAFVVLEGILFRISWIEWLFVVMAIGLVVGFELLNSAVERIASRYTPRFDTEVRDLKDTAAAGVLISAIAAAAIGVIIFFSRILSFLL